MLGSDQRPTLVQKFKRMQALLAFAWALAGAYLDRAESRGWALAEERFGDYPEPARTVAQVGTVITVVAIAVVAIVGILIYAEVDSSLGTPSQTALADAQSNVTTGFGDAMGLVPVILIVLLASLVIGVVQTLRG